MVPEVSRPGFAGACYDFRIVRLGIWTRSNNFWMLSILYGNDHVSTMSFLLPEARLPFFRILEISMLMNMTVPYFLSVSIMCFCCFLMLSGSVLF